MATSNNHSQQSQSEQHTIGDILNQLEHWRSNKANPNESIPDPIWQALFTLEQQFSASRLQKIFSLSAKQYQTKRDELHSHVHTQTHNRLSTIQYARMPESKKTSLKTVLKKEIRLTQQKKSAINLVHIADGAQDNWTFFDEVMPWGFQLTDFYRACQYLKAGSHACLLKTTRKSHRKI